MHKDSDFMAIRLMKSEIQSTFILLHVSIKRIIMIHDSFSKILDVYQHGYKRMLLC